MTWKEPYLLSELRVRLLVLLILALEVLQLLLLLSPAFEGTLPVLFESLLPLLLSLIGWCQDLTVTTARGLR